MNKTIFLYLFKRYNFAFFFTETQNKNYFRLPLVNDFHWDTKIMIICIWMVWKVTILYLEAVIRRCCVKKVSSTNLLKKRLWYRSFPVNFAKFVRAPHSFYRTPLIFASSYCWENHHIISKTNLCGYKEIEKTFLRVLFPKHLHCSLHHKSKVLNILQIPREKRWSEFQGL